jgi:sterol desaturase/sphingolipid hydroxylase (fatty acid hydroxylase superfamily)
MFDSILETFTKLVAEGETYVFLLPIYATLLIGERIAHAVMSKRRWDNHDAATNIFITALQMSLNVVVGHLVPLGLLVLIFDAGHLLQLEQSPLGWVAAFLLYDLTWYIDHRIGHRVGLFWAMHHVHHSSTEFNMTVASRGFIVDTTLLSRPAFYLMPLLGVSPNQFLIILIVTNIWGIAQHTRLVGKLGWLDWLLATPSNHRVHHGFAPKYIDRNYGELLMVWDRLFGTYQAEEEEPDYGVVHPIHTYNPVWIQLAGWRWMMQKIKSARGWRDKLRCLYRPPEWQPPSTGGV